MKGINLFLLLFRLPRRRRCRAIRAASSRVTITFIHPSSHLPLTLHVGTYAFSMYVLSVPLLAVTVCRDVDALDALSHPVLLDDGSMAICCCPCRRGN